jgi:RNA polymerase sigma-70 factor, ECF subfamily
MDAPAAPRTRPSPGLDAGWAETGARLRAFIARRVDNPQVADDLTQDVLTRSLAGRAFDTVDNPTGWLYRAARNAVIDHYRLRRRHDPLVAADERWTQPESGDSAPNDATRELAGCLRLTRVDLHGEPTSVLPPPPAFRCPA